MILNLPIIMKIKLTTAVVCDVPPAPGALLYLNKKIIHPVYAKARAAASLRKFLLSPELFHPSLSAHVSAFLLLISIAWFVTHPWTRPSPTSSVRPPSLSSLPVANYASELQLVSFSWNQGSHTIRHEMSIWHIVSQLASRVYKHTVQLACPLVCFLSLNRIPITLTKGLSWCWLSPAWLCEWGNKCQSSLSVGWTNFKALY